MARPENPPFPRGKTFYDGNTIDSNNLGGLQLEGKEWVFEDIDPRTPMNSQRSNRYVRCRIVRNMGANALLPKFNVNLVTATEGPAQYGRVDGHNRLLATYSAGIVDEYLPAAGVPQYDLCWIVVEGPTLAKVAREAAAANIALGDRLVSQTAVTSGSTTAGRLITQDLTGATAVLIAQVQNVIGRALSARTTADTSGDVLIEVGKF